MATIDLTSIICLEAFDSKELIDLQYKDVLLMVSSRWIGEDGRLLIFRRHPRTKTDGRLQSGLLQLLLFVLRSLVLRQEERLFLIHSHGRYVKYEYRFRE